MGIKTKSGFFSIPCSLQHLSSFLLGTTSTPGVEAGILPLATSGGAGRLKTPFFSAFSYLARRVSGIGHVTVTAEKPALSKRGKSRVLTGKIDRRKRDDMLGYFIQKGLVRIDRDNPYLPFPGKKRHRSRRIDRSTGPDTK